MVCSRDGRGVDHLDDRRVDSHWSEVREAEAPQSDSRQYPPQPYRFAGALIIGALGWIVVWIILSYEGRLLHPCPKRTTLGITVVSAGLLFMSRWIAPGILAQHVVQMAIVLGIAVFAYYAGCRGWLGKW